MSQFRRYAASLLTAGTLVAGAVVFTPVAAQADPQSVRCVRTMPERVLKKRPLRITWVTEAKHVDTTYNEDNQPDNCQYEGRRYTKNRITGKLTDHGTYRYWDLELEAIDWG